MLKTTCSLQVVQSADFVSRLSEFEKPLLVGTSYALRFPLLCEKLFGFAVPPLSQKAILPFGSPFIKCAELAKKGVYIAVNDRIL